MPDTRVLITDAFLKRVRDSGSLAQAAQRIGASPKPLVPLPKMSTWALVCEEVIDTEFNPGHYERVMGELLHRGILLPELEEMRVFAWETAGWLNFERMLWDWCGLDEHDIRKAIQWQADRGEIDLPEAERRLAYLARYTTDPHLPSK